MLRKIKIIFLKITEILFPISFVVAIGIDAFYKFNIEEGVKGYNIALAAYLYFCFYLAIILFKRIIKISRRIIKLTIYICLWAEMVSVFNYYDKLPINGFFESCLLIVVLTSFFIIIFLTLRWIFRLRKIFLIVILILTAVTTAVWLILNKDSSQPSLLEINKKGKASFLIQPWQLNSRYKINTVVKFLKIDLDNDGKDEIAAITSYDKLPTDVFYYDGFYRYNPATEMWDEFYSEELNILNYGLTDTSKIEDVNDFNKKIINIWSTEFTTLENIGDITGDGCPEIVFSSLIQGKYFDNHVIVAQAGKSHYRFKIFDDQNTMVKIVAEDGMLIEKYSDSKNDIKDIYEWDAENLYFKLIETQKTKIIIPEVPKIDPEMEEITG